MGRDGNESYICLFRKMTEWEWYTNIPVKSLFIHLLLKANRFEKTWQGITVHRGSFITSLNTLVSETGLTAQQIRTALKKLEKTGEIIHDGSSRKYSLITVVNYDEYQLERKPESKVEEAPTKQKKEPKPKANDDELEAFFDSVWKLYPRHKNDRKSKVTKARKKELQKIGYDAISKAIEMYLANQNPNYRHAGHTFFNDIICNWTGEEQQEELTKTKTNKEWQ